MAIQDRVKAAVFGRFQQADSTQSSPQEPSQSSSDVVEVASVEVPSTNDAVTAEQQESRIRQLLARVQTRLNKRSSSTGNSDEETELQGKATDIQPVAITPAEPSKIQARFRKLVETAKPGDVQKILEKLPAMERGPIQEIWPKVQAMAQMIRDPEAAWTSKAMAIGALVYLISPLDVIPDIIPITGLTDDAALIISVISTLTLELGPYLQKSVKKSMKEGVAIAEELADIEVRKHNRIIRLTLVASIVAAVLAIAVKFALTHMGA